VLGDLKRLLLNFVSDVVNFLDTCYSWWFTGSYRIFKC